MIDKLAGLPTQIRQLEKRLKEMDGSKVKPAVLKEITDTIQNLKNLLKEKMDKREQRKKDKEQKASEVAKESAIPAVTAPGAATAPTSTTTTSPTPDASIPTATNTPDDKKPSCALCGGMMFNDFDAYQQHMSYTHAGNTAPSSPTQKLEPTNVTSDAITDKVEKDPKIAPGIIVPDSVKKHDEVVERVEKDPKIAPAIISEKEPTKQFKLDDKVKPVRGSESTGKVMRWDGKPSDLVYVAWDSGPLADRDGFGGYYPHDLELFQEEPVEVAADGKGEPPHNAGPEHICPDCKDWHEKHADLRSNFDALLNDLKEERKIHYEQGNNSWVARLDQKITDLENSITEKFPSTKQACPTCGSMKEGGAENAKDLTIMDHTPPRANSGPDAGGKDSHDEFQDEWAMPAGIELESKLPKPQQKELNSLIQKAVYGYQINIMDMSKVYQAGEAAFISGQDVTAAVHAFLDSMVATGKAMKTAALKRYYALYVDGKLAIRTLTRVKAEKIMRARFPQKFAEKKYEIKEEVYPEEQKVDVTSSAEAFVTEPTKISVFKREFLATPVNGHKVFGGYDISQDGKKLFKINAKNSQPMTKGQLEFCAQIELTRGLKQAKLVEKIAFLDAGTKVYVIATDKAGKRTKFASLDHGVRGWVSSSKIRVLALESQTVQHNGHPDKVLGQTTTQTLLDCAEGGPMWVSSPELMDANRPPATPESLNDIEGLQTALPATIPNQRGYLDNPPVDKAAAGCDQCSASMINGVFCHETGCPNARKEREQENMEMESSLNKRATVVHHKDGWHVLSEKGKNLGGPYKSKGEAVKRLRQVEYFKHQGSMKAFCKKEAEVMVDPYQSLTDHITDMRSRMTQVQDKIQSNPVPKTAGENEVDNSSIELPKLFEDLAQGIDLLETKFKAEGEDEAVHENLEQLENLLWEVEMKAGITPKLPEHEKEEPKHKEVVEEVKEKTEKEADQVTDETITTNDPNAVINSFTPDPNAPPTFQNVQPTDQDNLEVPAVKPSSPPAPGQVWVYNPDVKAYVSMPDPANPGKTI